LARHGTHSLTHHTHVATHLSGKLWCKLADYYIRLGQFERARDVYEEALTTCVCVALGLDIGDRVERQMDGWIDGCEN
jgi:pentatricopeptide repeat protein